MRGDLHRQINHQRFSDHLWIGSVSTSNYATLGRAFYSNYSPPAVLILLWTSPVKFQQLQRSLSQPSQSAPKELTGSLRSPPEALPVPSEGRRGLLPRSERPIESSGSTDQLVMSQIGLPDIYRRLQGHLKLLSVLQTSFFVVVARTLWNLSREALAWPLGYCACVAEVYTLPHVYLYTALLFKSAVLCASIHI